MHLLWLKPERYDGMEKTDMLLQAINVYLVSFHLAMKYGSSSMKESARVVKQNITASCGQSNSIWFAEGVFGWSK